MLFRWPPPTDGELSALYVDAWGAPETHRSETGGTEPDLAVMYARTVLQSMGRTSFAGLRVLDFGAGRGELGTVLANLGADVTAIDPYSAEYLRSRGVRAHECVEDVPPGCRYDGLFAVDVLEHLADPWAVMSVLASRLTRGGWAYVSTPNARGVSARLLGDRWPEALNAGHLYFFTARSLQTLFKMSGFDRMRRLRTFIGYRRTMLGRLVNYAMQGALLDGALRFLAWKA